MRRLALQRSFLPLFLSSSLAFGATVRSVTIEGNSVFTARDIAAWIAIREGGIYSASGLQADLLTITGRYRVEGYLATEARILSLRFSADSSMVDLTIRVDEGRRSVVAKLRASGMTALTDDEIFVQFDTSPGSSLVEATLERDIENLLGRYENIGFPFARCTIAGITPHEGPENDSLDIDLLVSEGKHMTIDEVSVEGNKETATSVIVREARIEPGEIYQPSKVDAIRQRLNRLNIFSSVAAPELYTRGRRGGLLIKVQEGNTNVFDGILGYVPASSPSTSGYFTGLASVSMRNLFGTGRKLSLRWQREDQSTQEIGVRYAEPWVFGFPLNAGFGFVQRQQDTAFVRRTIDLSGEMMLSEDLSFSVVFTTERTIPAGDSIQAVSAFGINATTVGLQIRYDTRDDIYSPSSGARYATEYHYGRKSITSIPASLIGPVEHGGILQKIGVDLDFYLPTVQRQVAALGVHGREIRTGQVQASEMYRFGGATTLRGYRENQFLGSRIAWTNAEYRFILARHSYFFGFFDTGYYFRPADNVSSVPGAESFRYGYGIGIRMDSPLGNIGVSFALGQGDSFSTAKIHIGLLNEF